MYVWARGELGPHHRPLASQRLVAVRWRRLPLLLLFIRYRIAISFIALPSKLLGVPCVRAWTEVSAGWDRGAGRVVLFGQCGPLWAGYAWGRFYSSLL